MNPEQVGPKKRKILPKKRFLSPDTTNHGDNTTLLHPRKILKRRDDNSHKAVDEAEYTNPANAALIGRRPNTQPPIEITRLPDLKVRSGVAVNGFQMPSDTRNGKQGLTSEHVWNRSDIQPSTQLSPPPPPPPSSLSQPLNSPLRIRKRPLPILPSETTAGSLPTFLAHGIITPSLLRQAHAPPPITPRRAFYPHYRRRITQLTHPAPVFSGVDAGGRGEPKWVRGMGGEDWWIEEYGNGDGYGEGDGDKDKVEDESGNVGDC